MPGLENFALQTMGQAVGTGMGLLLADENDRRQLRQQEKLQKLGIKGSKEMTDYSYQKQLQLWKDTNYGAQMQELSKAGLNPGLLYGMGGQGGMTTGGGAEHVDGGKAPSGGGEAMGMGLMGAQMALLAAQTEKTKAETSNLQGQAANQPKIGENIAASTDSLRQGITNMKAQEALTRQEEEIKKVAASVSRQTINEQMEAWEQTIAKNKLELEKLERENALNGDQYQMKLELMKQQVAGEYLKNILTGAQANETNARVWKMTQDVLQGWKTLDIEGKKLKLQGLMAEVEQANKGMSQAGMTIRAHDMEATARQIDKLLGIGKEDYEKGYKEHE